jgi:hypothetical protein
MKPKVKVESFRFLLKCIEIHRSSTEELWHNELSDWYTRINNMNGFDWKNIIEPRYCIYTDRLPNYEIRYYICFKICTKTTGLIIPPSFINTGHSSLWLNRAF